MNREPRRLDPEQLLEQWARAVAQRGQPGSPETFQVYAHFPYCRASCRFCMYFHRVPTDQSAFDSYGVHLEKLCRQFEDRLGRLPVSSAYFGGGTPSALSGTALTRVATAFRAAFDVAGSFTCEAHPNTLDEAKIESLVHAGVNRVSMGIQTLDEHVLQVIGRYNRPLNEIESLVKFARARKVVVNVDLVAGLPEQSQGSLRDDIARVINLGADEVTVYRYQPVSQLPDEPRADMSYRSVFTPRLIARALRRGYLPYVPGQDAYSAMLYRIGPAWRRLGELGAWKLRELTGRTLLQPPGYWEFSHTRSHIIGLGTGAVSHLYGHAWYREVTSLDSAPARAAYVGTRVSLEDECRQEVLASLRQGAWCDARILEQTTGLDPREAFSDAFAVASDQACLDWRGTKFRFADDTPAGARSEVVDRIATTVPDELPSRLPMADIQSELVSIPQAPAASAEAVAEWCSSLEIPKIGKRFRAARVVAIDNYSVSFRVLDKNTPPLRVFVDRPGEARAYGKSARFALSYGGRRDTELTDPEREFLDDLVARTQAQDAPG